MKIGRVFALVVLFALGMGLVGSGCAKGSPCTDSYGKGLIRVVDNRDRRYPTIDLDWICLMRGDDGGSPPPGPPEQPAPPDVSVVSPPDPPGPKHSDGVVNAAIAHISCDPTPYFKNVNHVIGAIYYAKPFLPMPAALAERTSCFKNMTNGCDALRECTGVATSLDAATDTPPCKDGIAHEVVESQAGEALHVWTNCSALGLECNLQSGNADYGFCSYPNLRKCDPLKAPTCASGEFYTCFHSDEDYTTGVAYDVPRCSDYGFECSVSPTSDYYYCKAQGPECEFDPSFREPALFEYRDSVWCDDNTMLRTCVGGGQILIDCTSLNPEFQCLVPKAPYKAICGFDRECTEDDSPTCEGSSLVVCDGGLIRKVDCRALGFDSCNAELGICAPKAPKPAEQ